MRISLSLRTSYPTAAEPHAVQWMVERARAAREAGLDGLYVGDHHATGPAPYFQNVPLLGRLLGEWGDAPCGALFLLPLWHPVVMAEQIGTLAAISSGPFLAITAIGGGADQFGAVGVAESERVRRFEVGLDIVRRLLAGEKVSDTSGVSTIEGAQIAPIPQRGLEIWIGATAPAGIDRAARLGDGWLANAPLTPDEAHDQVTLYRERCAAHGRAAPAAAIRRDVHVAEDAASAEAEKRRAVEAGYRGFRPDALVAGDVEQVATQFADYAAMGYSEIHVRHFSSDQAAVLRSLTLLGDVKARLAGRSTGAADAAMS